MPTTTTSKTEAGVQDATAYMNAIRAINDRHGTSSSDAVYEEAEAAAVEAFRHLVPTEAD